MTRYDADTCGALSKAGRRSSASHPSMRCEASSIVTRGLRVAPRSATPTAIFRNPLTFAVLERVVLPAAAARRRRKRRNVRRGRSLAAGQEAYSLAMLMNERRGADAGRLSYRIFATDRSPEQVALAREGRYPAAALLTVTGRRAQECFDRDGDTVAVKEALKRGIEFSVFDLLDGDGCCPPDSIYGDFDIIFCANLLLYYAPAVQRAILDRLSTCLAQDGCLIVDETERNILFRQCYHEIHPHAAIFRR
ncbi:MAG: hypothetical protein IPP94_18100 [Ignavibacteria bacterium]|nr:hypothetical protein [Ignavibacteria bacterium]